MIDAEGHFTEAGWATKARIEALTDALAEEPYEALGPDELDELMALLEPIAARLESAGSA